MAVVEARLPDVHVAGRNWAVTEMEVPAVHQGTSLGCTDEPLPGEEVQAASVHHCWVELGSLSCPS